MEAKLSHASKRLPRMLLRQPGSEGLLLRDRPGRVLGCYLNVEPVHS